MGRRTLGIIARALLAAVALAGCASPADVAPPTRLSHTWMFGIEPMRDDARPQLPFTNRMIADLAAMPNVQVVFVGDNRNGSLFSSWQGAKLLVSPWLHGDGNCMSITYTIMQNGQQQAPLGVVIPPLAAGKEPDSACVDRATTRFYQALAIQGL